MNMFQRCARHLQILPLAALMWLLLAGLLPLQAQDSFNATHYAQLTGDDEVPAVTSDGIGVAIMQLDEIAGRLDYRITVTDLSGPITAAHFHMGAAGETGSPVHTISFPAGKTTATGSWTNLTDDQMLAIQTGGIYINVHTAQNTNGEIRGQVEGAFNGYAFLDAQSEVPAGTSTTAEGSAILLIYPASHSALYSLSWSGLSGPATAAHFHRAKPGQNGSVVQAIDIQQGDSTAYGVWTDISDEDMAALISGGIYMNVHTAQYPNGEIRGQVGHMDFYTAAISPQNEVPPVTGSNAEGTGFAISYFDPNTGISATDGIFVLDGNTNRITPAHVHRGAKGVSGPAIQPLYGGAAPGHFWYMAQTSYMILGSDTALSLKSGGLYVNFHSLEFPDGELRGQLIPGMDNLPLSTPSASVPVVTTGSSGTDLQTTFNRSSGMLSVQVNETGVHGNAVVALYSLLGKRIVDTAVEGNTAQFEAGSLPPGMYLVQLIVDGRISGGARVILTH